MDNDVNPKHWANAIVERQRYDMLTSNLAEFTSNLFKELIEKLVHPYDLFECLSTNALTVDE